MGRSRSKRRKLRRRSNEGKAKVQKGKLVYIFAFIIIGFLLLQLFNF